VPVCTFAENIAPTGIRFQTVLPVASRYTDWAIPAPPHYIIPIIIIITIIIMY
jgi:hypothetical protein